MGTDQQETRFLNDLKSSNSKQLLNAYIYDFLIKSSLPQTAQSFIREADIPTGAPATKAIKRPPQKDLLPLTISLDAPQGFLYEWWQIFWDVFNARTHRGGSENAQHYYKLQLFRQNKEHALHNSTFHAAHAQSQAQAQAQAQIQAQSISGQGNGVLQPQQQLFLQQQYQQQMLLFQQQQQQQQQQQGQQSISQPSSAIPPQSSSAVQTPNAQQMVQLPQQYNQYGQVIDNFGTPIDVGYGSQSIPQQDIQQHFLQQQSQLYAGQKRGVIPPSAGGPVYPNNYARVRQAQMQMNQYRQQQQQQQQQQSPYSAQVQFKAPQAHSNNNTNTKTNSPNKRSKLDESSARGSPLSGSPLNTEDKNDTPLPHKSNKPDSPIGEHEASSTLPSGTSALHDYQLQLMLLEKENKKMLNGSKKDLTSGETTKKEKSSPAVKKQMLPPKKTKGTTPAESPAATSKTAGGSSNAPTPSAAATPAGGVSSRKKKEPGATARRRTKKGTNLSEPPTPTTPVTPSMVVTSAAIKKETNPSSLNTKANTKKEKDNEEVTTGDKDKNTPSNVSQLTPPNSENANNANGDIVPPISDELANDPTMAPELSNDLVNDFSTHDDELAGSQMINGGHSHSISNDLYSDFPLSDFSNDIAGDANFNLETFLNTDNNDLGNFESYWRDGVEATD